MRIRTILPIGAAMALFPLAACGSGGSTSSVLTVPEPNTSSSTASTTAATCPTLAQVEAALGDTYGGPTQTSTRGGGIVCVYTATPGAANAEVTVFAHQSPSVYAGQVAHGATVPGMAPVSGVGNVAYALTAAGRTIVNAFSKVSRTFVAAQSSAALSQTEALARVTLADN